MSASSIYSKQKVEKYKSISREINFSISWGGLLVMFYLNSKCKVFSKILYTSVFFLTGPRGRQLEGDECPLHVQHPPTGEEFALGCGVCRNAHTF